MNITSEFINQSVHRIELNLPRIEKCLNELNEDEIWQRPNESSNSIGNLILHICGNSTQYIISSLGKKPDNRKRDEEFSARGGLAKKELLEIISSTVKQAVKVIRKTNDEELVRIRKVQNYSISGIACIVHVTEHISYHTGQIVFWTKLMKNKDMSFYAGVKL